MQVRSNLYIYPCSDAYCPYVTTSSSPTELPCSEEIMILRLLLMTDQLIGLTKKWLTNLCVCLLAVMTDLTDVRKWLIVLCRTHLPVPMFSRADFSVWSILKQCIGKVCPVHWHSIADTWTNRETRWHFSWECLHAFPSRGKRKPVLNPNHVKKRMGNACGCVTKPEQWIGYCCHWYMEGEGSPSVLQFSFVLVSWTCIQIWRHQHLPVTAVSMNGLDIGTWQ